MAEKDAVAQVADAGHLLHRLWTKAVGQPGYDKSEWIEAEVAVHRLTVALQATRAGGRLFARHGHAVNVRRVGAGEVAQEQAAVAALEAQLDVEKLHKEEANDVAYRVTQDLALANGRARLYRDLLVIVAAAALLTWGAYFVTH